MSQQKKKLAYQIVLLSLAVALIVTTLIVPLVHIVAYDSAKAITYDKTINLLQYFYDAPFLNTDASVVYFGATGPMWMAITAILANLLLLPTLFVLAVTSIFYISTSKTQKINKNYKFLRKIALFAGYFSVFAFVFEFVSFILTTLFANGYCVFQSGIQPFLTLSIGVAILVFGYLTKSQQTEESQGKIKNIVGFALTLLFSVLNVLLVFIPQFTPAMAGDFNSFYLASYNVMEFGVANSYGDIPIGVIMYAIFALIIATIFVAIYSIIGIIRTAKGKSTNWLSSRVKRWSTTVFVVYSIIYFLVCTTISVLASSIYFDDMSMVLPIFYVAIFVPFLPLVFSSITSYQKQPKIKKESKNQQK